MGLLVWSKWKLGQSEFFDTAYPLEPFTLARKEMLAALLRCSFCGQGATEVRAKSFECLLVKDRRPGVEEQHSHQSLIASHS